MSELLSLVPPEGLKIAITLFLCFLIGLEREDHKAGEPYSFGGVRTFPLIGLLGYALSLLSGPSCVPLTLGFAVVGGFMMLSFAHKLGASKFAGATTEISGLLTYVLGVLVQRDYLWIAATLVVLSLLLLELKTWLEGLSRHFAGDEILAFTKFLLMAAVILPVVPNQDFTSFQLNPYKTWLIVVAVSAVSYAGYALQRAFKDRGGVLLAATLGGAYSSTVTTVTLAKRAKDAGRPSLYSGAILMASGMMYLRLAALLALFSRPLVVRLGPAFAVLGFATLAAGWGWSRRTEDRKVEPVAAAPKNPLELDAAFLFAALFVGILIVTHLVLAYLGRGGLYGLAALMGVTDVDPFIMGMTQAAGAATPVALAASAIVVAAASNNAVKGAYAWFFADRRSGRESLLLLLGLTALGLLPLLLL
ncbi:MAG TPA: MgtC/SapB family protein [Elusimicrobiota bacterium]|jgi:uncharacterized membrane protein (DUF4010 family)|nr:MgtC/SapB family protein [Elusimicrobiota bacterium]